jgi:hypothetical protein
VGEAPACEHHGAQRLRPQEQLLRRTVVRPGQKAPVSVLAGPRGGARMVEPTGKQAGGVCHRDGGHGEGGGAKGGGEVLVRAGGLAFSFIGGAQGIGLHLDA